MTNNVDNITEGQASCLVLSFPPTEKNRAKAKQMFKDSPFTVSYIKGSDPLFPIAIGRKTQTLNPFKYISYPSTPPLIDEPLPIFDEIIPNQEEEESTPENDETTSERNEPIPENDKSNSENDSDVPLEIKEEENEDNYKIQFPVEDESNCYFLAEKNCNYKTTLMNVESNVEENNEDMDLQQQREAEERKKRDEIIEEELSRIKVKKEKLLEQSLEENDSFAIDDSYDLDNIIYDDDQSENERQETSESEAVMESPEKVSEIAVNVQDETPETTVVNENEQRSDGMVINEDKDIDAVTIQNEDENAVVSTPNPVKKKKVNIKILKSSVLAFSTKIFAKKTPEFPERYDYIFVSTADMLDYINQHIDVGDLSSKRYQYWLSKSNLLGGKVEIFQNDDGTTIGGRYLYVLKLQFRKKILRLQKQQDQQQIMLD